MTSPHDPEPDFDGLKAVREAEFIAWSAGARDGFLHGSLDDLEQAIATDAIADLSTEDRAALIDGFAQRCRIEKSTPATKSKMTTPMRPERDYRTLVPFAAATLPASVAEPFLKLSLARAVRSSVAYWVGIMIGGFLLLAFIHWRFS